MSRTHPSAVVIVNAVIGQAQKGKAAKAMDTIRQMLALRSGQQQTVEGKQLVHGDIVLLEAGDKVPADLRQVQIFRKRF